MDPFISFLLLLILTFLGVIVLGLIAGFSPTLYIAQAALSTKKSAAKRYTYSLIAGVLAAVVVLMVAFQYFNLSTLLSTVESAVDALFISTIFNLFIGVLFILAGVFYLKTRNRTHAYDADTKTIKKAGGSSAFFGFGFAKTFLSVSGATAVFIGGNIIANVNTDIVVRALFTAAFLIATVIPFWFILYLIRKNPERVDMLVYKVKSRLKTVNYRLTMGVAALLFGSAVIIFNVMMYLLY
jgi:hypothetical protein